MGREGLGGHSKGVFILQIANAKRRFSRLGDRSIYYIADGRRKKKNGTDKVFGISCNVICYGNLSQKSLVSPENILKSTEFWGVKFLWRRERRASICRHTKYGSLVASGASGIRRRARRLELS